MLRHAAEAPLRRGVNESAAERAWQEGCSRTNVTITAWIKPSTAEAAYNGLVFCRGSGTVAGFDYGATANAVTGSYNLGYHWNNEAGTYNWDSGITAS